MPLNPAYQAFLENVDLYRAGEKHMLNIIMI